MARQSDVDGVDGVDTARWSGEPCQSDVDGLDAVDTAKWLGMPRLRSAARSQSRPGPLRRPEPPIPSPGCPFSYQVARPGHFGNIPAVQPNPEPPGTGTGDTASRTCPAQGRRSRAGPEYFQAPARQLTSSAGQDNVIWPELKGQTRLLHWRSAQSHRDTRSQE
jgi:hypothetical protein